MYNWWVGIIQTNEMSNYGLERTICLRQNIINSKKQRTSILIYIKLLLVIFDILSNIMDLVVWLLRLLLSIEWPQYLHVILALLPVGLGKLDSGSILLLITTKSCLSFQQSFCT